MKRLSFLLACLCLSLASARAANVDGMVIDGTTGTVVSGATVTVQGSGFTTLTATTNALGYYSIALPSSLLTGTSLALNVSVSGMGGGTSHTYQGTSFTTNFITPSTTKRTVAGTVYTGINTPCTGNAKVWLIQKKYDPILMDTTLTAIDSMLTTATGAFCKPYTTLLPGTLLLKAALLPAHTSYASFLPTYFAHWIPVINWSAAAPVDTTPSFVPMGIHEIDLVAGVNPGGAGFIGGSVLLGANKSTGVGDPLNSRILLLTTASGQPVAYTYSNASGKFQFPNLAMGTYKIFGDALGKANPPLTITLTSTNKMFNNVIFEENSKKFEGHVGSNLAVSQTSNALATVQLYPNPAGAQVRFSNLNSIAGDKTVIVSNITGAVVAHQHFTDGKDVVFNTATLAPGIYSVQLHTASGNAIFKMVK